MTLRRIKVLYCVAVISIAVVLACVGGVVGWLTAIVMLGGALPVFGAIRRASAISALIGFRDDCGATPHNQSTDQVS